MAHRILGLDIGHTEVNAVLAEATWRATTVLGVYTERVPAPDEVKHRLVPAELEPETAGTIMDTAATAEDESTPEIAETTEPAPPWVYAIGDLLKKQALEFNEVYVTMPGTVATSRIISLPFENRRRLEQVLPFELENLVPFDLEKMHLSFEVLGKDPAGGFHILVTLTPHTEAARFLGHLAEAGIDPKVVVPSPYALFAAAKQALPGEMGTLAVMDLGATHTDVAILSEGELIDLRTLPFGSRIFDDELGKAMNAEGDKAEQIKIEKGDIAGGGTGNDILRRTAATLIGRLRQTFRGVRSEREVDITRIYLTGRGSLMTGMADFLGAELDVEVDRLQPLADDLPVSIDLREPVDQSRFSIPFALINLGLGDLRALKLNLRHGLFSYKRQQLALQSSVRNIAIVGGIVLVLFLYNVIAGHMQKRRQYEVLSEQVVELYMKAFPGSAPPLRPLEQFQQQIGKTVVKHKTVGFFGDSNLRGIEILKALSEQIPFDVKIDI